MTDIVGSILIQAEIPPGLFVERDVLGTTWQVSSSAPAGTYNERVEAVR
jgi:hypothetical protein